MQGDAGTHLFWADSVETQPRPNAYVATDGPSLGLAGASSFKIDDQFRMFQLYHPPGNDWAWVPLNKIEWSVFAEGTYGFSGDPVPNSSVGQTSAGATTTHPEWTNVFGNTGGTVTQSQARLERKHSKARKARETRK